MRILVTDGMDKDALQTLKETVTRSLNSSMPPRSLVQR